jgi:hypothetical protein
MEITISGLTPKTLKEYKFNKQVDGPFIKETINTEIDFFDDEYATLLAKMSIGETREDGIASKACGENQFSKMVYIKHNEGSFDMAQCSFTKKITFSNPLDCLIKREINIFDYEPLTLNPTQGQLVRLLHSNSKLVYFDINPYTLEQVISALGGIPDKRAEGYAIESVSVSAVPLSETVTEEQFTETYYVGHTCEIFVSYVGFLSLSQVNESWINIGLYWFFNPDLIVEEPWGLPLYNLNGIGAYDYTATFWQKGKYNIFKAVPISNTISLNEVLTDIFDCSGLDLISNFLGINSDSSAPENKEYQFALANCQNIKIVQSYDVIKASALEDSFGKSGVVKTKDLLEDICLMFNLKIVPDTTAGILRIEHISYFSLKAINLSAIAYKLDKFKLNENEIDQEEFYFAKITPSEGFYKVVIDYERLDLYKEPNPKKYTTKLIITDVLGTLDNAEFTKDDYKKLFYLLASDGENLIEFNAPFAMKRLVTALHTSNRPGKSGLLDGVRTVFDSFSFGISNKIEILSNLINWDLIQPFHSVYLKEGTFQIESLEIDETDNLIIKIIK